MFIISKLVQIFNAWKDYNRTCNELYSMSDKELNDLGIHRSDIERIAAQNTLDLDGRKASKYK